MNTEEEIFEAAAALPEAERAAYLDACTGDSRMRARIEALLRSHEVSGFMDAATRAGDHSESEDQERGAMLEAIGQRIGRYKLLEQIGEGGFGVVWVAEQLEPVRRRVALKIIKPGMDSREVIARFEAERQALAMMDHPNIAKVFDAGTTDAGRPYFAMELVRGVRITEFCDQANLPTEERLRLFATVCQAVQHAHQKGIIHRDLKPSNILVAPGDDGQPAPRVIDFGVAKAIGPALTDGTVYTRFEQMIGTPAYMSPEQAGLGPMDIDTRSDIYSLGVLLYELLTGRPPFDPKELVEAGLEEMRRVIREVDPPKPSTRLTRRKLAGHRSGNTRSRVRAPHSAIDQDLDWIVMKAIDKDRTRRYETANGLALDIQRFLDCEPVIARPPGFAYRTRKFVGKHKGPVVAAAAVLATLLAGLTASTILYLREKKALTGESEQRRRAEAGEKAALTESAKNAQTARFLMGMLEGVKPEKAKGENNALLLKMLAKAAQQIATDLKDQPEVEVSLRSTLGSTYGALGVYDKAQEHYEEAIKIGERIFGAENAHTLACRRSLASVLQARGKREEAKVEARRVVEISTRATGPEHTNTLVARIILAAALYEDGWRVEAEAEYRAVIAILSRVLGPEDPLTLSTRGKVASILDDQGKPVDAEVEHRAVLKIQERVLGVEHPDTLHSRLALAYALGSQNKRAEAIEMIHAVIKTQEVILGADHPATLKARSRLAGIYNRHRQYKEAEAEYRAVYELQEQILGEGFPATLTTRSHLASLLSARGKYAEAEAEFRAMIGIESRVSGPEHYYTLTSRRSLALALNNQGKYRESETEYRAVLKIQQRVFGPEHPESLAGRMNVAYALDSQERYAEAEAEFRDVLRIQERVLGSEHADTLMTRMNLSGALYEQSKPEEAAKECRTVTRIRERVLGEDHQDTVNSRSNLASILNAMGNSAEAEAEHRKVLASMERKQALDHPVALVARFNIAVTLRQQDKLTEAEAEFRAALAGQERVLGPQSPATLRSLHELAATLQRQGRTQDALEVAGRALKGRRETLGIENPDTKRSAKLYKDLGGVTPVETAPPEKSK